MLKEKTTNTWLKNKIKCYVEVGQIDTAMKFIEVYGPRTKDFNREEAIKLLEKPKKQPKKSKESKKEPEEKNQ